MIKEDTKVRDVYVPVSLICASVVLMLLQAASLPTELGDDRLQRVKIASAKILFYIPVLLLGMGLSGMFGYSFAPIRWSLLQLLAVALSPAALRDMVGYVAGDSIGTVLSIGLFLGLIGYFFNEDAMDALVAIFLVFAAHSAVTFLLTPLFTMFLASS